MEKCREPFGEPVLFADPVENKALSELVLLDKRTAADVRATLKVMLTDSERRQQLIQELIRTNNQLKEDVQSHMRRSVAQTQRASELETLLEGVRVRVQELEERCVGRAAQTHGEMQQLQHDKRQAQKLVQDLEQALMKQKEEVSQLQKKLHFAVREEEQRVVRQSQAFEQICRRTARQSSAHDQQYEVLLLYFPIILNTSFLPQLLSEISSVVTGPNAPLRLHRQKPRSDTLKMNQYQPLVPTLELWAQQLRLLKDLQQSLNNLSARLLPWQPSEECPTSAEPAKVEDMMLLVDTLLENTSTHDEKVLRSPTRHTLGSMVAHFQKLFDVSSLSGVYPRMNEVYCRLGEMNNAMRNIRDALSLGKNKISDCSHVHIRINKILSSLYNLKGGYYVKSTFSKLYIMLLCHSLIKHMPGVLPWLIHIFLSNQ
uniref:Centrosomal protein of 70 kDa n=1 Tax=Neogobius melanostomus TaxID=47308 RepID=A0A8C6S5V5_9GOBI